MNDETASINPNLPFKSDEARTGRENQRYNPQNGARMVAGCICMNSTKDKVIMILSTAHTNRWVFPKGGVEIDEGDDYAISAIRETWEEAGCEGKILNKLPVALDSRGKKAPVLEKGKDFDPNGTIPKSEFHFYEMMIEKLNAKWPELKKRQRKWCTYSEAKHELLKAKRPELVEALDQSCVIKDVQVFSDFDE